MLFLPLNKIMPFRFSLFIALSLCFVLRSQNRSIDSLLSVLNKSAKDTLQAATLDELCWQYISIDPSKTEKYAKALVELSRKIKFKKGEANGYASLGSVYYFQGNYTLAIANYEKAITARLEMGDIAGAGAATNNKAMVLQQQGNYTSALENYIRALKLFENIKDEKRAAKAICNIAVIYYERKDFKQGLKYSLKALEIWERLKDNLEIATNCNNVANNYSGLKQQTKAIEYYEKALAAEGSDPYRTSRIYYNLGMIYIDLKDYKKAEKYLDLSFPLKESIGDKEGMATGYYALGLLCSKTNRIKEAITYFKKTEALAKEIGSKEDLRWAYAGLKEALYQEKEYIEAFKYADMYDMLKDTLYNESSSKQIAEMQTKYESEKKEKENALLISKNKINTLEIERQRTQRNGIIIVFILTAFLAFIVYNRYRLKNKNKILQEQNLRNLAVFKAQEEEKARLSKELHDGVGPLLSLIKLNVSGLESNSTNKKMIEEIKTLASQGMKEVRNISHALMPSILEKKGLKFALEELIEQVNHTNTLKINLKYLLNSNVLPDRQTNLFRIIQETVSNTLKYANATEILIEINETKNHIHLNISDNGLGFDKEITSSGNGLNNIFSRVEFLKGTIELDTEKGKGTTFKILIPLSKT